MIELVGLKGLRSNPKNPRRISRDDFEKLSNSIKRFPQMLWKRPIVVNTEGVVLGGNMRLKAIQDIFKLDISERTKLYEIVRNKSTDKGAEIAYLFFIDKKFPVDICDDLTPGQEDEFIIKDNGAFGEWDMEEIANEWSDYPLEDWGLKLGLEEEKKQAQKTKDGFVLKLKYGEVDYTFITDALEKKGLSPEDALLKFCELQ